MSPLGIVTNCWRAQLAAGASLIDLIAEAVGRGYRAIELRQTCLGEFEAGDEPLPLAAGLNLLPEQFPGVRFNQAVAVPFLQPDFSTRHAVFDAGKWAAQAVAGESPPHLRLVDPFNQALVDSAETTGRRIADLVRAMIELDGLLSVEHSRQPWREFRAVFDAARAELGHERDRLRLCYDPCNLLIPGDEVEPAEVTRSLDAGELSLFHAKQRRGVPLYSVTEGEVDWVAQGAALKQIGYAGPILFEIEPHADVWENLESSRRYLQEAGFELAPGVR